jgi:acyl-coenzyme A thioesterase PaaI-like protein
VFFVRERMVVTGELSVRYLRPCPVEQPLAARARIVGEHARYLIVDAELSAGDLVLARSSGKFFPQARAEAAP